MMAPAPQITLEQVATVVNMLITDALTRRNARYADLIGRIAYWQNRNDASY